MRKAILILSLFILSCETSVDNAPEVKETLTEESSINIEEKSEVVNIQQNISTPKDSMIIQLTDFDLVLSEYGGSLTHRIENLNTDTIHLEEGVEFNLDHQLMTLMPKSSEDKFEVSVSLEQDLRVSAGEKHIVDLEDFHVNGPFEKIIDSAEFYFRLPAYNYAQRERDISENLNEIKAAILNIDGEYIPSSLDSLSNLSSLPFDIWISKVLIKIHHFNAKGDKKTYLIINHSSWGC
tara:strand:+ start:437 stop:1147 length:711 start_codon:yes stop_codon:yes gene_type:complete